MKPKYLFISIFLLVGSRLCAQSRVVYGRVLDEELQPVGYAIIRVDTSVVGKTDTAGRFKIKIPAGGQSLSFFCIGMEASTINLNAGCDTVELIMMNGWIYDYISLKRINRLRKKRFNKLPEVHLQAYKKGLFAEPMICYTREFKPYK